MIRTALGSIQAEYFKEVWMLSPNPIEINGSQIFHALKCPFSVLIGKGVSHINAKTFFFFIPVRSSDSLRTEIHKGKKCNCWRGLFCILFCFYRSCQYMNEGCNLLFFVNVNFAVAHSTGRMNKFDFKGYPMQKQKCERSP